MRACLSELEHYVGRRRRMDTLCTRKGRNLVVLIRRISHRGSGPQLQRRFLLVRGLISLRQRILECCFVVWEMLESSRGKKFSWVGKECGGSTMRFYRMRQIIMRRSGG